MENDEYGEYCLKAKWVEAWKDKHYLSGWSVCEVRKYRDGSMRVHIGEPRYLQEHPEMCGMHSIYMIASAVLAA